ncbi:MAG TPA: hypothetical protein EYP87_02110 [Flavobacteriaceae bacterium]|nr:hypothetical protein [Flavobacteriaceae bacterium]
MYKSELLDRVVDNCKMARPKAKKIFDEKLDDSYLLFLEDIIKDSYNMEKKFKYNKPIILDDNDGIDEEVDDTLDTDGDDIPNYLDIDDDGDGILTANEINSDGTFIDTDGDNIFNHLDDDDDGDSIPTLNEFETDSNGDTIVDYLDATTQITQTARTAVTNKHTLSYTTIFIIENMSLYNGDGNAINYSNYEFGVKTGDVLITN